MGLHPEKVLPVGKGRKCPRAGLEQGQSQHNARKEPSQSILSANCEELNHVTAAAMTFLPQEC